MRERDKPDVRHTKKATLPKHKRTFPLHPGSDNLSPVKPDSKLNIIADLSKLTDKNRELSPEEAGKLIHNLQVHQIDLEVQNEELRRAKAELEESRNKYFEFYDLAPISYFSFDRNGIILEANLTAAKLLGAGRSNLIGKPLYVFLEDTETMRFIEHLQEVFNSSRGNSTEIWIRSKKGDEYYAHLESISMPSSKGCMICRTSIIDITKHKQAEEALKQSEYQKTLVLDNTSEIIAYHDTNNRIQWANKAYLKTTTSSLEELKTKKCYETWGLNKLCCNCPVIKAMQTGKPCEAELTPQNQEHWPSDKGSWLSRAAPVKDAAGAIIGAIEVAYEITERKKAEKLLSESEEMLKEQKAALEQKNMALKEMIEQINIEKNSIKKDIAINIEFTLMPVISKLKISEDSKSLIDLLKYHLNEIASSFGHKITQKNHRLTPRESEICCMIKGGLTSKEICNLLNVSNLTIAKHRRNIRKKLGLSNEKINLTSFLNGL